MRLQNTQLRDKLQSAYQRLISSGQVTESEAAILTSTLDGIHSDETGQAVLSALYSSEQWQKVALSGDNNSAEKIDLSAMKEGTNMPTAHQHHIENIRKKIGDKKLSDDVVTDVESLMNAIRTEMNVEQVTHLRQAIREDLFDVAKKVENRLDAVSLIVAKPKEQALAMGWRTAEFLVRVGIFIGAVALSAWILKKIFEGTTPMVEVMPG